MGSLAEEERWRAKDLRERMKGMLEILALIGVGVLLVGIVVVCLRVEGQGSEESGELHCVGCPSSLNW